MRKIRKLITLICTLALLSSFCVSAHTATDNDNPMNIGLGLSRAEADQFVSNEILSIIERGSPLCIWNENTKWSSVIPLYDCYSECNGYVYILETDQQRTGYLQVNQFGDELVTYCYSYKGIPAYEGLNCGKEGLSKSADDKLYFFGNMSYCVKTVDEQFKAIDSVASIPVKDTVEYYEDFVRAVTVQSVEFVEPKEEINHETRYSSAIYATDSAYTLVTMNEFSNLYATRPNGIRQKVAEHCSPTAATNIMRYFRENGSSPLSNSLSNTTIFMELYYAMDTNNISSSNTVQSVGTSWSMIEPGISSFSSNHGCAPTDIGTVSNVSFNDIKDQLDHGRLLQMELIDFPQKHTNHSVVVFDYSNDYIVISTGWDTNYHDYKYADLDIGQYVYVGY